jgi:hypothetical protein
MSDDKKGNEIKKVLNEDLNKSLTHNRPKPESKPPNGRESSKTQSTSNQSGNKKDK